MSRAAHERKDPLPTIKMHPSECVDLFEVDHIIHTTTTCPMIAPEAKVKYRKSREATIMLRNHDAQPCRECVQESVTVWVRHDGWDIYQVEPHTFESYPTTLAQLKSTINNSNYRYAGLGS